MTLRFRELIVRALLVVLVAWASGCNSTLGSSEGGNDAGTHEDAGVRTDADITPMDGEVREDAGERDSSMPPRDLGLVDLGVYEDSCEASLSTYYFSASDGDDARSESEARSPSTPWRTLEKLSTIAATLPAGGCLLLRRGDRFNGSITIAASGSASAPIVVGAYGTGARPVLSGFHDVLAWDAAGGNVWTSREEVAGDGDVNMVAVAGVNTPVGRLPDTGYYTMTAATHDSLTDSAHSEIASNDWSGAQVVVRSIRWVLDRFIVTSSSGATLNFTSDSIYTPSAGWGYFIQRDLRTLSAQNEWFYDRATHRLAMWSASEPSEVRVASIAVAVNVEGSYLVFDNLSVEGYNEAGIDTNASPFITVQNSEFSFIGRDGVEAYPNSGNLTVTGSSFYEVNSTGIRGSASSDVEISGNTLFNIGNIPGMGAEGSSGYEGIVANGERSHVAYNTLRNVGYCGIKWDGDGSVIEYNVVDHTGYIKDDGGGIYTYPSQGPMAYEHRRIVRGNIVLNSTGAGEGSSNPSTSEAHGIYNDGTNSDVDYVDNVIVNAQLGLFLNGAHEITVSGNTIYDCARGLFVLKFNEVEIDNISVHDNVFVARTASQYPAYFEPSAENMPASFSADNNYYARPINDQDDEPVIWMDQNGTNVYMTLAQWSSHTGDDATSHISPRAAASDTDLRLEYNASGAMSTVSLDGSYVDIAGTARSGTVTLEPYTSLFLIRNP